MLRYRRPRRAEVVNSLAARWLPPLFHFQKIEQMFEGRNIWDSLRGIIWSETEAKKMSENEKKLIEIVRARPDLIETALELVIVLLQIPDAPVTTNEKR